MAFSSSPSSSYSLQRGGWTYDVFLSFRGEDTRYGFIDHLYAALVKSGITVFKDDKKLLVGKEISPELFKAIEESTCAVVVLSKNYANSSWCLAELTKIMECHNQKGRLLIPVFYHVHPSDVRKQKGDFETAFLQHQEKSWDEVIEWRKALTAVGKLSGHHISETDQKGEHAYITKIVRYILGTLQPGGMDNNLVDIKSRIKALESYLNLEATQEVRMVGIWGMGGIGKTTIARALFRRISSNFDGSSFVEGVREKSKKDMCALQIKILKDVTHHEFVIEDPEDGAEMIQTRFCRKKVLLVLDDVDDMKQLEFLAKTHKWFGKGSRVIITTRDRNVLLYTNATYKPAILLKEQAIELFSRHAFRRNIPPESYKELLNRVIRYTGGLPLAVKVLGSRFYGREAGVWESVLNRLAKTPNFEIFETLKVSFDGLCDDDKNIFLDIACFFKGHHRKRVTRLLNSFGFDPAIGITVLIEKSLITVSNERLNMHDLLHDMGLEIVRKSYPNSRLWQCKEIHDIITEKRKLHTIEAIVSVSDENSGFSVDVFENMKNIRLLDIWRDFTSSEPTTLPDGLRWLRWARYPFHSLRVAKLNKLVGLEITMGRIKHLQMGQKIMENLKFIHLERLSCNSFPDVSGALNIESLILSDCVKLVEVHKSLGTLRKLTYLNMSGCCNLKRLPSMIKMRSLVTLDLSHCYRLERFPEISSSMEKLSSIHLNVCLNLEIIPSSICELKSLKSLHLNNCVQLQELPRELGSMENLEELQLGLRDHSMASQRKPNSFNFQTLTTLCYLRKLDLSWRPIKDKYLNNLRELSSLEELHLSGNSKLVQLPRSIYYLHRLKHLELNDCQQLLNIQGLPSRIQVLKAGNCRSLEKIEDLTEMYSRLYKIWLSGCETLLDDEESETHLNKMLCQSFLEKCANVDNVLSIAVPGSKIPRWFEEQRHGKQIALKFPPKRHTDIMGFVVCSVLRRKLEREYVQMINTSEIHFTVGNDIGEPEVYDITASATATEDESVWIVYVPFSLFQEQMYNDFGGEDWFLFARGNLIINILEPKDGYTKIVRCGAHIIYEEDVGSIQCIPDYKNSNLVRRLDDSFAYIEKFRNIDIQVPL